MEIIPEYTLNSNPGKPLQLVTIYGGSTETKPTDTEAIAGGSVFIETDAGHGIYMFDAAAATWRAW